jgi:hypothetical protein
VRDFGLVDELPLFPRMKFLHPFLHRLPFLAAVLTCAASAQEQHGLIDSMDAVTFKFPAEKGHVELVEGHTGQAATAVFDALAPLLK